MHVTFPVTEVFYPRKHRVFQHFQGKFMTWSVQLILHHWYTISESSDLFLEYTLCLKNLPGVYLLLSLRPFSRIYCWFFSLRKTLSTYFHWMTISHFTHAICLIYLRYTYIHFSYTSLLKSLCCLFNLIANNPCNAWNKIFSRFKEVKKNLKCKLRYLLSKSFSRCHNLSWLWSQT